MNHLLNLHALWVYVNENCIWKPDFNAGCPSLETDPQEIITGRWKRVKTFYKTVKADNKYVGLYRPVYYLYYQIQNKRQLDGGDKEKHEFWVKDQHSHQYIAARIGLSRLFKWEQFCNTPTTFPHRLAKPPLLFTTRLNGL